MRKSCDVPLSELTTLRLGGPAARLVEAVTSTEVVEAVSAVDAGGEHALVIAGGSNLVVADAGFDGTAIRVATRGIAERRDGDERVELTVAAGEPWDDVVSRAVADGLSGIECLCGIPGSAGATPIQNVGAYGQEVAETIVSVRAYDRPARKVVELSGAECGFAYRSSAFKGSARHVVLDVTFALEVGRSGRPVRYAELARALGVEPGAQAPLLEIREAVLGLRRAKGMVLDPRDADSVSAGSFFVNPVLDRDAFAALGRTVHERLGPDADPPAWPEAAGAVKTSAAWLIERAGFHRGYGAGRAGISTKHTLALVNRGGASTGELLALAREIRDGVGDKFGVTLRAEPTLVGVDL